MLQDVYCKLLCQVELKKNDVQTFKVRVVVSMLPPLTRRLWMWFNPLRYCRIPYTYSKIDCDHMSDWWWWWWWWLLWWCCECNPDLNLETVSSQLDRRQPACSLHPRHRSICLHSIRRLSYRWLNDWLIVLMNLASSHLSTILNLCIFDWLIDWLIDCINEPDKIDWLHHTYRYSWCFVCNINLYSLHKCLWYIALDTIKYSYISSIEHLSTIN